MNRTARISGPRDGGRGGALDPRVNAWREDLADVALADRVAVPRYAAPVRRAAKAIAELRAEPRADAPAISELLPGEAFNVLEVADGWAWGQCAHDGYVGFVSAAALGPSLPATHIAGWSDALVLAAPNVKAPAVTVLPAGARLAAAPHDTMWWRTDRGYVHRRHLLPLDGAPGADWVAAAHNFLGAPYKWGGRSRAGIDCSGLVQVALGLAGVRAGRDSDMQATAARACSPGRGALAFWPGHVGILIDGGTLLHANAHWMTVVAEPLADVERRAGAPAEIKRLD